MRTNIDIDDDLMAKAMAASEENTKKAVVESALRLLVQLKAQDGIKKLRGKVVWRGHDDDWFASDKEILERRRQSAKKTLADDATLVSGQLAGAASSRQR
ncbi:MAG: type II toxin-antitoxin system VapB family antitoxin [Terracidiphilus sp.]|jgi:Arc/MetJ family transcription regulator